MNCVAHSASLLGSRGAIHVLRKLGTTCKYMLPEKSLVNRIMKNISVEVYIYI